MKYSLKKHKLLLISLSLAPLLLAGCVKQQPINVKIVPDYEPDYLECVADEWERKVIGECVDNALRDWMVQSGL